MAKLIIVSGLMAVFLIIALPNHLVNGECCPSIRRDNRGIYYCADGTVSTPYCGYGPCNIFGCNCDGGCRRASGQPASPANGTNVQNKDQQRIFAYSKSHAEQLDLSEAYDFVKSPTDGAKYNGTVGEFTPVFKKADKDNNGKLTFEEINQLSP